MTTILLTLDESDSSHHAALVATMLFGPDVDYLAVHVEPALSGRPELWGAVYGYGYPGVPAAQLHSPEMRGSAIEEARLVASQRAAALGVDATPLGEVGDPAEAIRYVAEERGVDVVVVGDHHRSWFRRLFESSVAEDLVKSAGVPILVVPTPDDA